MRKNRIKNVTATLSVLALLLFVIAGTYSRYSSTGRVTMTANVAKWSVAMTSGGEDLLSTTQEVNFIINNDNNVVEGKFAPGTTATATVELDLTGTEVAVDFDATIDQTAFTALAMGASYDKISLTTKLGNTTLSSGVPQLIGLENGSAFTAVNGVKTITLTLVWENDDNNNADDTAMGIADRDIVIPVTFTAKQHISAN